MTRFSHSWPRVQSLSLRRFSRGRRVSSQGFTLVELLVTSILICVITTLAWTGLLAVMDMSHAAQAKTARQMELNKALDFMTNEIRMAQQINATGGTTANGTPGSLQTVVQTSGLTLQNLGNYGTLALYLERPTRTDHLKNGKCPADGPNAGKVPPAPKNFDRVVYDIRTSPSGWLPPGTLMRYGRVPNADGSVDPCRSPIASDPIADSLSMVRSDAPACPGHLYGAGGFYTCVQGNQVDLFFQSSIPDVGTKDIRSAVSSRLIEVGIPGTGSGESQPLTLIVSNTGSSLNLEWTWDGQEIISEYVLRETEEGQEPKTLYTGTNKVFSHTVATNSVCFQVSAKTETETVTSDQVCWSP
ncbi:prepilin-type N-terminal cleavage/methylation domain-containing protein [Synechococcales cyanobacterium C]|uniref:Prepilin-type N-terminal cleavage/methylation domain-containing protein n=1 Tax=Petrachloros mirabilis ULC683 TaxID=2781853 RepID=A0A8K1ZWM8_9CYAN|nr:prepilin-type N-terminal cleavage/methylation domain-containing protein [Petrachloros mirabilis]NCJ05488.1 prepilin-type N-terminal cleavage/methylation domain-containing protein [Petrachloros mirabilis ULC683]